jgi:hypothetical protein
MLYLAREHEGVTHVCLSRNEEPAAELTLAEARELRDALTALLAAAGDPDVA